MCSVRVGVVPCNSRLMLDFDKVPVGLRCVLTAVIRCVRK